ncbi:hypothetical protein WMY93_005410 [Mugilogobius chulae]|uniref:Ubiquitin-like protease family profile domain-containing protein n=1 Tax=Mugilogobius chulae TaxID=88201 RepID=A0AAW0PGY8_9GOBI
MYLRHRDFRTLRPHQWFVGEAMKCSLHAYAIKHKILTQICLMFHYTAGNFINGNKNNMSNQLQLLPTSDHQSCDGVMSLVNINNNHWNLLVNPMASTDELEASINADRRIGEFLSLRQRKHSMTCWKSISFTGAVMKHPYQQDGYSCGVLVLMMAEAIMEAFPQLPEMDFFTSKEAMADERR